MTQNFHLLFMCRIFFPFTHSVKNHAKRYKTIYPPPPPYQPTARGAPHLATLHCDLLPQEWQGSALLHAKNLRTTRHQLL